MRDVTIASGFDRFPLLIAAAEMERAGRLNHCIAGFYPTHAWRRWTARAGLAANGRIARLSDRLVDLPEARMAAQPLNEMRGAIESRLRGAAGRVKARHAFGQRAASLLRGAASDTRLYHYRSGFGHQSAITARSLGMLTLGHHSIAHPGVLDHLVTGDGTLPPQGEAGAIDASWSDIRDDLNNADAVLVNSDFVKQTFVHQGWDADRIHVIYQGVDRRFLDALPSGDKETPDCETPLRLTFAGAFETRKGADHLAATLQHFDDTPWRLELIGDVLPECAKRHDAFLADPRVEIKGRLGRQDLAVRLSEAEIFFFPSKAEGSARVVFEALAAGCYALTTPNSGSIVEDGLHGTLVQPGDIEGSRAALRQAFAERERIKSVGANNAKLVHEQYHQGRYGERLLALYDRLLNARARTSKAA